MFNLIADFFRGQTRRKPVPLVNEPNATPEPLGDTMGLLDGIHPLNEGHIEFILSAIQDAAKSFQFNPSYLKPENLTGLYVQICDSLCKGKAVFVESGKLKELHSQIWVYQVQEAPIAFLWVTKQPDKNESELYLLAVALDYRRKGIASELVDFYLAQAPRGERVTARIYRHSPVMLRVLNARGFQRSLKQGKFTINLHRQLNKQHQS